MYKVGQRVWVKSLKCFGVVESIQEYQTTNDLATLTTQELCYAVIFDDGKGTIFKKTELHETADDMFEKLGYTKREEQGNIITYKNTRFTIAFDREHKEYWHDNETSITIDEHLTIHQKGIELGWWE